MKKIVACGSIATRRRSDVELAEARQLRQSLWSLCPLVAAPELTSQESLREASTMDGALSKLLKPPTSQREGPCMLEHHEAGRAF